MTVPTGSIVTYPSTGSIPTEVDPGIGVFGEIVAEHVAVSAFT